MNKQKLVPAIFLGLGVLFFLLATSFLTNSSESALVDGAMGLIPCAIGAYGAWVNRRSVGRAIGLGLAFGVLAMLSLVLFFSVIWPML